MWGSHSLKISFFFLLCPSFQNRSSRDLISSSPHKELQWSGWFLSFLYLYTGRHFMTIPLKTEKITTWGAGTLHVVWVKTEHYMNTGYWGGGWAPGQLEGGRQRQRVVFSTSLLPTWHTCPSLYLINLILIIWRLTCLLADGVVLGHSIKGHQASVLSCLQDLGQVFSILNLLFLSLSIDSGTTYVRIQR